MKNKILVSAVAAALFPVMVLGAGKILRIQTPYPSESTPGAVAKQFVDDIDVMSSGRVKIQMHWSSELVGQTEVLNAVAAGILDCSMASASSSVGKDPAFQFAGDVIGGYDTPYQFYAWYDHGGGKKVVDKLFDKYGVHMAGYLMQGQESLSSIRPLAGIDDLKNWKFRSPPGLETEIFAAFGAKPVVMDFGEVPSALRTGIVDGADASSLNANQSIGLFDTAKYVTYPGFHSMPSEVLACNKNVWNELSPDIQRMMEVAIRRAALDLAELTEIKDKKVAREIAKQGITVHDWSTEDRKAFRDFAKSRWQEWRSKSKMVAELVNSHVVFMKEIGLID